MSEPLHGYDEKTEVLSAVESNGKPLDEEASILGQLKARRADHDRARTFDLEVPGMGRQLVLRLGPLPGKTLTVLRERIERSQSPDKDVNLNADMLLAAVRGVWVRALLPADELGELRELTDEGESLRVDERLADKLGIEAKGARALLLELFGNANSPEVALVTAAGQYTEWAASATSDADEEFLGE